MKYLPAAVLIALLVKALISPLDWPLAFALVVSVAGFVWIQIMEFKMGRDFKEQLKAIEIWFGADTKNFDKHIDAQRVANRDINDRLLLLETTNQEVHKLAEDSKKLISSANLGMAFRAPTRRNANNNAT